MAGLLAGCSQGPNLSSDRSNGGAKIAATQTDDAARVQLAGLRNGASATNKVSADAELYQNVEFRTEIRRAGVEIVGADCSAVSSDVSIEFKSPAKLRLPVRGAQTPPLKVTCAHPLQGGVATAMIRPGAEVKSGGLLGEVFGGDKPAPGAYLPSYTLQLAKSAPPTVAQALKTAAVVRSGRDAPPPALAAALEKGAKAGARAAFDVRLTAEVELEVLSAGVTLPLSVAPTPRPSPRLGGFDLMPRVAAR